MAWTILPGWLGAASIAMQTKSEMNARQAAASRGGKKNKSNKNKQNKRSNKTRRTLH